MIKDKNHINAILLEMGQRFLTEAKVMRIKHEYFYRQAGISVSIFYNITKGRGYNINSFIKLINITRLSLKLKIGRETILVEPDLFIEKIAEIIKESPLKFKQKTSIYTSVLKGTGYGIRSLIALLEAYNIVMSIVLTKDKERLDKFKIIYNNSYYYRNSENLIIKGKKRRKENKVEINEKALKKYHGNKEEINKNRKINYDEKYDENKEEINKKRRERYQKKKNMKNH